MSKTKRKLDISMSKELSPEERTDAGWGFLFILLFFSWLWTFIAMFFGGPWWFPSIFFGGLVILTIRFHKESKLNAANEKEKESSND